MSTASIILSIIVVVIMVVVITAKPEPHNDYVHPVDQMAGGYPTVDWIPYAIPVVIVIGIIMIVMMLSAKPG